jgi:hypothetical protein
VGDAGAAGGGHRAEVEKVHIFAAVSALPNVSFAPVVIVAVKVLFAARVAVGTKAATLVADT